MRPRDAFDILLTVFDVGLKCQISVSTVYRLVENREIPYLKIGGQIRFRNSMLNKWLEAVERKPLK